MRFNLARLAGALSPLPILIACASAGVSDANVITAPELSRSKARNVYDAIRMIRPEMLRIRDPGSVVYFNDRRPAVAVDNSLVGGVEVLRALPARKVSRIEFVNPWVAAKRYGAGFTNGVVLVETQADSEVGIAAAPSSSR